MTDKMQLNEINEYSNQRQVFLTCSMVNTACDRLHDPEWVLKRKPVCSTMSGAYNDVIKQNDVTETKRHALEKSRFRRPRPNALQTNHGSPQPF